MQFKYSFTKVRWDNIPFLEVVLKNPENNESVGCRAMVDSGAFISVFHSELAEVLGIDLGLIKSETTFQGVGDIAGSLKGKIYFVDMTVWDKTNKCNFICPVLFSDNIDRNSFSLLGRKGFFDHFDEVVFNIKSNKFYLRTNK